MGVTFCPALKVNGAWHHQDGEDDVTVSVCNGNAGLLLKELGIEWDNCGVIWPPDLLNRIAVRLDKGGFESPRGFPADYVPRQLDRLVGLANEAIRLGCAVGWA